MFPVKSSLAPEGSGVAFSMNPHNGFTWIAHSHMPMKKHVGCGPTAMMALEAETWDTCALKSDLCLDVTNIRTCIVAHK